MRYVMIPVVTLSELEESIELQYGVRINIEKLFWGTGAEYEELYYSCEFGEDEVSWYGELGVAQMNLVCSYLRETIPNHNVVLVHLGC